jgi:hypothetical protein
VSRSTVAYPPDVDATCERAVARGAKGYGEPSMFVTGDRYAAFLGVVGHPEDRCGVLGSTTAGTLVS